LPENSELDKPGFNGFVRGWYNPEVQYDLCRVG